MADGNKILNLLDFFIVSKIYQNYIKIDNGLDVTTDHSTVIMILIDRIIMIGEKPTLANETTDWVSLENNVLLIIVLMLLLVKVEKHQ